MRLGPVVDLSTLRNAVISLSYPVVAWKVRKARTLKASASPKEVWSAGIGE